MPSSKSYVIKGLIIFSGLLLISKLFFIQVLSAGYRLAAEKNIVQRVTVPPYRGVIYDRNGEFLVYNVPIYDLLVTPKAIKNLDTLAFCQDFDISLAEFNKCLEKAKSYSYVKSSVLIKNIDHLALAKIQDRLGEYRGFTIQARIVRSYPKNMTLANTLGYLGEISAAQLEADTSHYYNRADLIGIHGLEKYYEPVLRGKRGYRYVITDARGQDKGSFKDGALDILPISGKDLTTTVDQGLQQYGEKLMQGKLGSIVAIQPSTGEILAMVSSPSYNPNSLIGRNFGAYFANLEKDSLAPLFNRPVMAMYPPGSIFKLVHTLIGLEEKLITPGTSFACNKNLVNCHPHPSPTNLHQAIQYSCNPYFFHVFKKIINQNLSKDIYEDTRIGLDKWLYYVKQFGLGKPLGIDIPNEKGGYLPDGGFYDARYGKGAWKASTIRSLDIGQGELLLTPLQMANLAAIIANKGYYYQPHLAKAINNEPLNLEQFKKCEVAIDKAYFNFVINAMLDVVNNGIGWRARIKSIGVCGKTGTAENPHGADHAVFMGFAPVENPSIAIAVYVENAGWGPRSATAIAGLMIEKYLTGRVERKKLENYVLKGVFLY
jgi:penicillin-binding protein 2